MAREHCNVFFLSLFTILCCVSYIQCDTNGGTTCAACDVIFGLTDQLAVIHNESIVTALKRLCSYLPEVRYQKPCRMFAAYITPIIIEIYEDNDSADVICHKLGLCYEEQGRTCNLFPVKQNKRLQHYLKMPHLVHKVKHLQMPKLGASICTLPGISDICHWVDQIFNDHMPAVDLDGDKHSTYETLRGYAWRGKDCNDGNKEIHPGARTVDEDRYHDSNCNGIMGKDPDKNIPYEETFCSTSNPRGVAVLGDSVSAHFHLPREWFNSTELSPAVFEALPYIAENELDWPAFSYVTGFMNATDTLSNVLHGYTDSLYLRLWQHNRCNFRDYQNIAVNGAASDVMAETIEKSLYRNQTGDYPLIVIYALVGNDVCNGHPDTIAHMTTPEQMKENFEKTLQYLDNKLPAGSHLLVTGLADGRMLYDNLHNRTHPIGSLKNDVTYAQFYDYFNCLEVSPCTGWMNSNSTLRDLTSQRAEELSQVLEDVIKTTNGTFKNFYAYYLDNALTLLMKEWAAKGRPGWELLEPVDGFHTNQKANAELARLIWEQLEVQPEIVGKLNPYNKQIESIFGDQGGYR